MDFDLINNVVAELAELLTGSRVAKIYQPSPEILIFKLWTGRETLRLLVSAEGSKSRIHLTEQTWPNPHIPPRFCQLLRARISRINSIEVVNRDRIVQLKCAGKHGDCLLMIELTGKNSNLALLDTDGLIIDVLKRVAGGENRRSLLAGEKYHFPEKKQFSTEIQTELREEVEPEDSWNMIVEKHYSRDAVAKHKMDFRQQLLSTIQRHRKKLQKRIVSIEKELVLQENGDRYRQFGDLLLANLYTIKPNAESIELINYYSQPEERVVILLDPLLSPQQNAEKYFKKYKKARRGREHGERRRAETQTELAWIEQLEYQLRDAVKNSDIEEIADELRREGLLKEKNNLHKKRTLQPSKPHEGLSPSGCKILWGRNNRQNDELSTRIAKSGDLWFHAQNIPGSHVLLQVPAGTKVAEEDILYAAALAAGYSRARNDNKVDVMVADAKFIHKPVGSKAGLVTVLHYKTLLVKPFRLD